MVFQEIQNYSENYIKNIPYIFFPNIDNVYILKFTENQNLFNFKILGITQLLK